MREPRWLILIAFLGLLAAPFLFRRSTDLPPPADARQIIILTPHNEQIRHEFGRAFEQWHEMHYGERVSVVWSVPGGTNDIRRMLESQFAAAARDGRPVGGNADLLFGGGQYEHDKIKQGVTITIDGQAVRVPISEPVTFHPRDLRRHFGAATLTEVYGGADIGGNPLFDPEGHWLGAALSGFGIVYNRPALTELGLPPPRGWVDLTHPRLLGWVALGNPAQSGSTAKSFDTVLQRAGWTRGWQVLRRAAANARYFSASSSKVPIDVSQGDAAAGVCIDFYGRYQSQAIADAGDPDRLGYIDPPGEGAIDADPVSLLRGAPQPALATRFMLFCLTDEAQSLWQFRHDEPRDDGLGPDRYELRRLPIIRGFYTRYLHRFVDRVNPYDFAQPFDIFDPAYGALLPVLFSAMAIDQHAALTRAWRAIVSHPAYPPGGGLVTAAEVTDPALREMLERFDAMPTIPGPQGATYSLADPSVLAAVRDGWLRGGWSDAELWPRERGPEETLRSLAAAFFRGNYEWVAEASGIRHEALGAGSRVVVGSRLMIVGPSTRNSALGSRNSLSTQHSALRTWHSAPPPVPSPMPMRHTPPLTKIIATIGPASRGRDVLTRLIDAGVSVFRLNFSHGSLEAHADVLTAIRSLAAEAGRRVAVLGDLQGPKIRIGKVADPGVELAPGDTVLLRRGTFIASPAARPACFGSTYERLVDDVEPGQRVLIADGAIRMLVVAKRADELECSVTVGGVVTSGKGINLPDTHVSAEALSDHDLTCVKWAVEQGLDFLALSFVRSAAEVVRLRELIAAHAASREPGFHVPIIAKIEQPSAVERVDEILEQADGIMVARGDLGVELELARVPVIQKRIVLAAADHGKPCIVATQMLESMIQSPMPTRAEASDVANAILDGADAVMLSGETAVGRYPVLAVDHMRLIAQHTEAYLSQQPQSASPPLRLVASRYRTAALAHGAWTIARDYGAKLIVVWSQRGGGARLLSQNNFQIPIIALSGDERALRQMQLLRGVTPIHMEPPHSLADFTRRVDDLLLKDGWAALGDRCILMAGSPLGVARNTNTLALHEVGNPDTGYARVDGGAEKC